MRGGGPRGGGILPFMVLDEYEPGPVRRSGELFPCGILLNGARAGSFEGEVAPDRDPAYPMVLCLTGRLPFGVLVAERGGGGPRMELPGRDTDCCFTALALVVEGGAEGVLERGGCLETAGVKLSR